MHPALFLEEILRIIFTHRHAEIRKLGEPHRDSDLFSLARTCRTFKEPALDLLWMYLSNPSQLVRCLPCARRVEVRGIDGKFIYALERDLEPAEVDTVKAYARRVRVLVISDSEDSQAHLEATLGHLCRLSQFKPLFPNLRQSLLLVTNDVTALLPHFAVKNLRKLDILFFSADPSPYGDFMRSLSSSCPGIQDVSVKVTEGWYSTVWSNIMIPIIRRWTHLRSVHCPDTILDIDTFFHLSRLPSLTRLSFAVDSAFIGQIEMSNHVFVLPTLQEMSLYIISMVPDSEFLTHMRLPALKNISMWYRKSLTRDRKSFTKDMIRSFEAALRTVCNRKLVAQITLDCCNLISPLIAEPTTLVVEDVLPFAAFNLTRMRIDLNWTVDMKDDDLLRLASDCPRIESFSINCQFGWRSAGITPVGLLKVLRLRPSLREISIALDTRGYQALPHELESSSLIGGGHGDPLPSGRSWVLDLVDSVIEAESVPALAAFFADCMPSGEVFSISSWKSNTVKRLHDDWEVYETRWRDVDRMAKEMIAEKYKHLCSHGEE